MSIVKIAALVLKTVFPQDAYIRLHQFYKFTFCKKEILATHNYALEISRQPKKEKITLVFVIWMESMWNSLRSVYETAVQDSRFEVFIIAQPHITDRERKYNQNPAYIYLSSLYKNVINAFENGKWFDLNTLNPDYVFYTYPYSSYYHENYAPAFVREKAKICLIQYGFSIEDNAIFDHVYNFLFSKNVAIHFVNCQTAFNRLTSYYKYARTEYPKIVNLGFPRFDLVCKQSDKNKSGHPCILWTPRWTKPSQRKYDSGSSFLLYYKNFLEFASLHKDVDFIVRPHPLMFPNFLDEGIMTQTEIDNFRSECKKMENLSLDESEDYLNSVNKADIFIADLSALVMEFFITGKPVVFCADAKKIFSKEVKKMDSVLYHAFSWQAIESIVIKLLAGLDEMKNSRSEIIKEFNKNDGVSKMPVAHSILDFIKKDYYGE